MAISSEYGGSDRTIAPGGTTSTTATGFDPYEDYLNWSADPDDPFAIPDLDPGETDDYASLIYGYINMAQWQDYLNRFQPYEQELAEMVTDFDVSGALSDAGDNVSQAYDQAEQSMNISLSQYGLTGGLNNQQTKAMGLSRAANTAAAKNEERETIKDLQMGIAAGGLSSAR